MRVMLIDDHALFRIGLQELLERRGIEVYAVGDCLQGVELVLEERPDVVLLDMRMPNMNGIEMLKQLRQSEANMPIAMLTTSREEKDVIDSLQNGAQGYLLKDMEPDELIDALQEIVQGNSVVAKELTSILAKAVQGGEQSQEKESHHSLADLTPREREILCHSGGGAEQPR